MKKFPWLFSALWLLILAVMISAGFWQLRRAAEKQDINDRMAAGIQSEPKSVQDWNLKQAFDQVQVAGVFGNTHFLLDNQIMNGQVGFHVYTTFQTNQGLWLLINRGWHDQSDSTFDLASEPVELSGLVADWPRPGVQLGEQIIANADLQQVTYLEQDATMDVLRQRHCKANNPFDCVILPLVLKLDPKEPGGFERSWQLPRMTVAKHQGYAAQWFSMSLVLCLVYGIFITKHFKTKQDASKN